MSTTPPQSGRILTLNRSDLTRSAKKLAKRFKANESDTEAKLQALAESIQPDMSDSQIGPVIKQAVKDHGWNVKTKRHAASANTDWTVKRLRNMIAKVKPPTASKEDTGSAGIILAMNTLAKCNQANKDQARVSERAREQVQGKLKGSMIQGLRYLQSALEAFDDNFDEATKFVKENNTKAKALSTTHPMCRIDYHAFCGAVIRLDHPRLDKAIESAADNGEHQGPSEPMHTYIARCAEDHETCQFGMACAKWSAREIQKSFATSISAAIAGLHDDLRGTLPHLQKEKEYLGSTLQWDEIRAKAGARESDSSGSLKRRKLAPAAVVTQGLSMEIQTTIRTATEEAVRNALNLSSATNAAPAAAIAPLVTSDVVDTIISASATATRAAIDEFARTASAMIVQPGPPQQPQQPATNDGATRQGSPYKRPSSWPANCNSCNIVHQRYEECPRCICRKCGKQGHMERACKSSSCSDCGSKQGQGHTQSCRAAKNQQGRRR
jgi:hypothetical protein